MEQRIETKIFELSEIKPADYNPRISTSKGKKYLENSFREFGYVDPIIVNIRNNTIVGGHQRYSLMLEKGVKRVEAVIVDFDESKEKALNIALNKTSEHFEWDNEKLADIVTDIKDDFEVDDFGVDLTSLFGDGLSLDNDLQDINDTRDHHGGGAGGKAGNQTQNEALEHEHEAIDGPVDKNIQYTCQDCGHKFTKGAQR